MSGRGVLVVSVWILTCFPSISLGQSMPVVKTYDDCITRYAAKAPSPQAAVIMQRACFYKYRYNKDYLANFGAASKHQKLARIYTPAVCDCIFEKMPSAPPQLPAASVLDECLKASKKPDEPTSR